MKQDQTPDAVQKEGLSHRSVYLRRLEEILRKALEPDKTEIVRRRPLTADAKFEIFLEIGQDIADLSRRPAFGDHQAKEFELAHVALAVQLRGLQDISRQLIDALHFGMLVVAVETVAPQTQDIFLRAEKMTQWEVDSSRRLNMHERYALFLDLGRDFSELTSQRVKTTDPELLQKIGNASHEFCTQLEYLMPDPAFLAQAFKTGNFLIVNDGAQAESKPEPKPESKSKPESKPNPGSKLEAKPESNVAHDSGHESSDDEEFWTH